MLGLRNAATQKKLLSERNLTMSKAMKIAETETGHLRCTITDRNDDN